LEIDIHITPRGHPTFNDDKELMIKSPRPLTPQF
jgi:hypothetical protein